MKNAIIVLGLFFAGVVIGSTPSLSGKFDAGILPQIILYVLIVQVGLGLGAKGEIAMLRKNFNLKMLAIPACTIGGTIVFSAIVGLALSHWRITDCIALGCGFGYYSLSSVLISELKEITLGADRAAALATLALLTNIARELMALTGTPLLARHFGKFAPIAAAGVTSMDSALPVINRHSGADAVPVALAHGIILEIATPLLVTFFCTL